MAQSREQERSEGEEEAKCERGSPLGHTLPLHAVKTGKRWQTNDDGDHRACCLKAAVWSEASGMETATDGWAHPGWKFSNFPKTTRKCKFKTNTFHCSKNSQTFHDARFQYYEQLSQLGQLQIAKRIHVINLRTYSNLNFL
jgi:hypothetical protein